MTHQLQCRNFPSTSSDRARLSRRAALLSGGAVAAGLAMRSGAGVAASIATPIAGPDNPGLVHRGISYDTGWPYRETWSRTAMRRDIAVIQDDLHCTDVTIHGSFVDRLTVAGEYGAERGLHVWLQPRLPDVASTGTIEHLVEVARVAEQIRVNDGAVSLNVGCELPLFMDGIVDGSDFFERIAGLIAAFEAGEFGPIYAALNDHLGRAAAAARAVFGGELTYSSAVFEWSGIDWSPFDYVGMDHYRDASNLATYVDDLRAMRRHGKPIIVTEFGCGAFEGADLAGSASWEIVDWTADPPRLNDVYVRSEETQATYLMDLLDIFEAEAIRGAFVYTFLEESIHDPDPRLDLDMASFGVVKLVSFEPEAIENGTYWQPKQAFHALGERYAKANDLST